MKYYSVDYIVQSCLESAGYPIHWYADFLHYVLAGYRELQFDLMGHPRHAQLLVKKNGRVRLPEDFTEEGRVYVINSLGEEVELLPSHWVEGTQPPEAEVYCVRFSKGIIEVPAALRATELNIVYLSDGMDVGDRSLVEPRALAAIEAYAMWQFYEHKRGTTLSERERWRGLYTEEYKKLARRRNPVHLGVLKKLAK